MYKIPKFKKSTIKNRTKEIGEQIHDKIKAVIEQGENLQEAPLIYTDKADGVMQGYNIRTDKWEVAVEAMDKLHKIRTAKGEAKRGKLVEMDTTKKEIETEKGDSKES